MASRHQPLPWRRTRPAILLSASLGVTLGCDREELRAVTCGVGAGAPLCQEAPDSDCTAAMMAGVPFAAGSGSAADPFQICSARQLDRIGDEPAYMDAAFVLRRDLDLAALPRPVTMIGSEAHPFAGSFDGAGHVVRNLELQGAPGEPVGLFAVLAGAVRDLGLEVRQVCGLGGAVGTLAGLAVCARVERCHAALSPAGGAGVVAEGSLPSAVGGLIGSAIADETTYEPSRIVDSWAAVPIAARGAMGGAGGLVGGLSNSEALRCHARAEIDAAALSQVGGLVGKCWSLPGVSLSYAVGRVRGGPQVGGLVGLASGHCDITDAYARCDTSGDAAVGGLLGKQMSIPSVRNAYALGAVAGREMSGGLAGEVDGAENFYACFWSREASPASPGLTGLGNAADTAGVAQRSLEELRRADTFEAAGWDLDQVWALRPELNDGFPVLRWQLEAEAGAAE